MKQKWRSGAYLHLLLRLPKGAPLPSSSPPSRRCQNVTNSLAPIRTFLVDPKVEGSKPSAEKHLARSPLAPALQRSAWRSGSVWGPYLCLFCCKQSLLSLLILALLPWTLSLVVGTIDCARVQRCSCLPLVAAASGRTWTLQVAVVTCKGRRRGRAALSALSLSCHYRAQAGQATWN